ncbi:sulfatase-like hydrolase/transferase [Microbacterium sp. LWS13-1.2]|uniref:Sulfatase-like hydrolase/transferase n=1 Tax=Microbacterium sp. LWS13-1.2 TaxID=3135264 RepID=A0AAU6SEJ3_9MICO
MPSRPNLILITTDQQRSDTIGERSPSFLRTPHLDHLAREGMRFTRAYADNPVCVPARVSIMTGKTVLRHGMAGNAGTSTVMGRLGTLPALLRAQGYQTAAIGKMHFTPERARHGFDEMVLPADYYREMAESGSRIQPMRHGLGQNELYPGMATVPESMTLTSWIAERAVDYIWHRRDPTVPFFLWVSFSKPHPPLDPPEPYYSMYRDSPIPEAIRGDWAEEGTAPEAFSRFRQRWSADLIPPETIRAARAAYYGLVTQIDYNIGRVLAALHDLPAGETREMESSRVEGSLLDESLLLFTSDHGEYLGDHGSGGKFMFHEPSSHIPFIIRPPKGRGFDPGQIRDDLVCQADILPTLLGAAGAVAPDDCDGRDLLADTERLELVGASSGFEPSASIQYLALVTGQWKYIWYPEGAQQQLFDLAADPDELMDLALGEEHADRISDLRSRLLARVRSEAAHLIEDDDLPVRQLQGDTTNERRARGYPAFHHEHFDVDVRH